MYWKTVNGYRLQARSGVRVYLLNSVSEIGEVIYWQGLRRDHGIQRAMFAKLQLYEISRCSVIHCMSTSFRLSPHIQVQTKCAPAYYYCFGKY